MNRARSTIALLTLVACAWAAVAGASDQAVTAGSGGYRLVGTFGKVGSGRGQVSGPRGIVVARNGTVYVADTNNNRVELFSAAGAYKGQWGASGSGDGQFTNPRDVDIAPDGTIWVADDGNARGQAFSPTGAFKGSLSIGSESARGIAVDATGNVFVAAEGGAQGGFRTFAGATGSAGALLGAGAYSIQDVDASPDGTVYLTTSETSADAARVRHFTADGKPLGSFHVPNPSGVGVDLDCNVWAVDFPNRAVVKYSPTGKKLATATAGDLQANDIAVGPNGDVYVTQQPGSIVHFAEDRSKPGTATIPGRLVVAPGGVVKVAYALTGVACPLTVAATATLSGAGIAGKAAGLELTAGKTNVITIQLAKGALKNAAASGKATFKIVLKTNGRPTTQTKTVTVSVPAGVK